MSVTFFSRVPHLKITFWSVHWSPHIEDPLFSDQSATLYITYYLIQIIIYRPFLPPSLHSVINITPHVNMPVPCIAICVNASKCVSRILKAHIPRGYSNIPILIWGSHVCAAILLMNFWDLKWQERTQMRRDDSVFEGIKSPLGLAMTELLEGVSVFIEALEAVKPRWRSAEIYLSALTPFSPQKNSTKQLSNRNDLSSSLPQSLGGYEPSIPKNDPLFCCYPSRSDDQTSPPDYTTLADYRHSLPEYPTAPPPTNAYAYHTQVEPSECLNSPQFSEFPHITRCSVPGTFLVPPPSASCAHDQSMSSLATMVQYQRGYNGLCMQTELGDQKSLTPSTHSQPASLAVDESLVVQQDPSTCRRHPIVNSTSYNWSVSAPTHPSVVGNLVPRRSMYVLICSLCVSLIIIP